MWSLLWQPKNRFWCRRFFQVWWLTQLIWLALSLDCSCGFCFVLSYLSFALSLNFGELQTRKVCVVLMDELSHCFTNFPELRQLKLCNRNLANFLLNGKPQVFLLDLLNLRILYPLEPHRLKVGLEATWSLPDLCPVIRLQTSHCSPAFTCYVPDF